MNYRVAERTRTLTQSLAKSCISLAEAQPGDIVVYRCADCLDRWDLVLPDEEGP